MTKPYGSSSPKTTIASEDRLDRRQDDLGTEEPAECRGDGALEDLELVAEAARDDALELGEDRLAVGEHVQAEDDDENERSEDGERHLGNLPEGGRCGGGHGRLHVAVQGHEVWLEGAEGDELGPVAQRAFDACLGQREVGGRLRHVRADRGGRPEQQEASADQCRGVHGADGDAARQLRVLREPPDDRR